MVKGGGLPPAKIYESEEGYIDPVKQSQCLHPICWQRIPTGGRIKRAGGRIKDKSKR